ncbi:MAG: histidine kinase [Spirochaetia bacterium]|nr:histidine kinase [Spirochaetia bacterium]
MIFQKIIQSAFLLFSFSTLYAEASLVNISEDWQHYIHDEKEILSHKQILEKTDKENLVSFTTIVDINKNNEVHYFIRKLPKINCLDCVIYFPIITEAAFVLFEDKIYPNQGAKNFPLKTVYPGKEPLLVPINLSNTKDAKNNNYIVLGVASSEKTVSVLVTADVLYGERSALFKHIFYRDFDRYILFGVFLTLAIIAAILFIMDTKKFSFFFMSLANIAILFFSFAYTDTAFLFGLSPFFNERLLIFSLLFLLPLYLYFLYYTTLVRPVLYLAYFETFYAMIALFFDLKFRPSFLGAISDLFAGTSVVLAFIFILTKTKDRKIKKVFWISFLIALPVMIYDLLIINGILSAKRFLIPWGYAGTFLPYLYYQIKNFTTTEKSLIERDNELLQAKLTNLKDKMNPHFVRNTLTIISTYLRNDTEKAKMALKHLTNSYNYLLENTTEPVIELHKEIKFARDYADILLMKYSDMLEINFNITGSIENILIPMLSLQPIIENAYKHGVRKLKKGKIDINIKTKGKKVEITVSNTSNGKPFQNLFNGTLGAIKRRLQFIFEEANLTVTAENKKTIVFISYHNRQKKN